ncbi:phosphotransferase family protein [Streptomyces sp. NPDC049040]|uniref:phosphotransferase family protein n=1 Tax=Streptomyces sp. NPDC049040 TaxID=3365593 RepID=UPI00371E355B
MTSDRWSTHTLVLGSGSVSKRFRGGDRDRALREWRALRLLDRYAPGLAPAPREADLDAAEPTVVMSRLAGVPLRGMPLGDAHVEALAAAVTRLHDALPPDVLAGIPLRPGHQGELIGHIRSWLPKARPRVGKQVGQAMDEGMAWLDRSGLDPVCPQDLLTAFGPGDGNLANYLWDGQRVQVVDFEDSGRSDRAFELAEITEHVASWVEHPLDVPSFLGRVDLTPAESLRLRDCRRLLALVWLFLLAFDDADDPRNPPGTAERQADRLLSLLA